MSEYLKLFYYWQRAVRKYLWVIRVYQTGGAQCVLEVKAKETKKCHHRQLMQLSFANCDE
jgi:hypothetical protein